MQRSVLIEEWCTLHSFTYKRRVNLFPEEISAINRQSRDHGNDGRDVFATTKMFMHSTNLHAPPLLVLPVDRLRRIATREPRTALPAHPFMEDRLKELNAAAKLFKDEKNKLYDYYVPAASKYYLDLIEARRADLSHFQPAAPPGGLESFPTGGAGRISVKSTGAPPGGLESSPPGGAAGRT